MPAQRLQHEAGGRGIPPFPADRLALARGQRTEEVVEAGIALVVPVELRAEPPQPAGLAERVPLRLLAEGDVDRREVELPAGLRQPLAQRLRPDPCPRPHQQPRAWHRAEGGADLQLRVVAAAGPLEGIGPAIVEDVFALAVALRIHRAAGDEL